MASSDIRDDIPPPSARTTLRNVPWRWSDLAIGLAPTLLPFAAVALLGREDIPVLLRWLWISAPRWLWIPLAILELGWIFAYPLWVARRRVGLPARPRPRSILIEGSIALVALPVVMVALSGLMQMLSRLLGPDTSLDPFEATAGSPDRYQFPALVVLAVAVAPFAEEVFFRGMIYNALRRRMPLLLAVLIQGVVFGLMHPFGLARRVLIATIGVALGLLYEWRKTLVAPIVLHSLINVVSMAVLFQSSIIAANAPVLGVRGEAHGKGCLVTEIVPGGAAEAAGLLVGDVISAAGENSVRNLDDLVLIMRTKRVGDRIPVWFRRGDEEHQVEAVLQARPGAGE